MGSRGALRVVGARALVQGAVLEAGGGKCEVGFGSEAKFCGVGGDSAEDRLGSGGHGLVSSHTADAGGDGFFGG